MAADVKDVKDRFIHCFAESTFLVALGIFSFTDELSRSYFLFSDGADVTFDMR